MEASLERRAALDAARDVRRLEMLATNAQARAGLRILFSELRGTTAWPWGVFCWSVAASAKLAEWCWFSCGSAAEPGTPARCAASGAIAGGSAACGSARHLTQVASAEREAAT